MTVPAVSVLFATYNQERWVVEALDSLAAQTYRDFEVVITDDHSTDSTAERVRDWLERTGFEAELVVNPTNMGVAAVRNAALRRARGELICGLSGDDRYSPQRLELQAGFLQASPDRVGAVYSDMRVIDEHGHPTGASGLELFGASPPPAPAGVMRRLLVGNFLPAPATMVRRSALDAVGAYDESLVFEDYDMWLRIADRFEMRFLPGAVVDYRLHEANLSRRPDRAKEFIVDVARVQARWAGRHPDVDWANARRIWGQGREFLTTDPETARMLLELAHDLAPASTTPLALELAWQQGSLIAKHSADLERLHTEVERAVDDAQRVRADRELLHAEVERAVDDAQRVRADRELLRADLEDLRDRIVELEALITATADNLDELARSRLLRALDVVERPLRSVRPGDTVRVRLHELSEHLRSQTPNATGMASARASR